MDNYRERSPSRQYRVGDIQKIDGKFPCLICGLRFRLRRRASAHMTTAHNAEFVQSRRTASRLRAYRLQNNNTNSDEENQDEDSMNSDGEDGNNTQQLHQTEDLDRYVNPTLAELNQSISDNDGIHFNNQLVAVQVGDVQTDNEEHNYQPYLDMPLYELNNVPSLTREEHILACIRYSERFKISGVGFTNLMDLIKLHLPIQVVLDRDLREVQKMVGFHVDNLCKTLYCKQCGYDWDIDQDSCIQNTCMSRATDYFTSCDLVEQFKMILMRPGIYQEIVNYKNRVYDGNMYDICDGQFYRLHKEEGGFLHGDTNTNLTCTVFIDGVVLYKSSHTQIWAYYLLINELPPSKRFDRSLSALWGVWQGVSKPKCFNFIKKFAEDATKLFHEGFQIVVDGQEVTIKVCCLVYTQDLAARAFLLCMRPHKAAFACHICNIKGEVIESGDGNDRNYSPFEIDVRFRTADDIAQAHENIVLPDGTEGFIGRSPLFDIPLFTHFNVCIDSMHCVFLGVLKSLYKNWFVNEQSVGFIGDYYEEIDQTIRLIKPCKQITRLPRGANLKDQKASENRAFLLLYSLYAMEEYMPVEQLKHLALLVESMHILASEKITPDDLNRARENIDMFVNLYDHFYHSPNQKASVTLNIHNLIHLVDCVENWGPSWCTSVFSQEGFNYQYISSLFGRQSVKNQMFWVNYANKLCASKTLTADGQLGEFLRNTQFLNNLSSGHEYANCTILGSIVKLSNAEKIQLLDICPNIRIQNYRRAGKILIRGVYIDSKVCTRIHKRISYYAEVSPEANFGDIAEIDRYVLNIRNRKVYAVCVAYKYGESIVPNIAKMCTRIELISDTAKLLPADKLLRPVCYMIKRRQKYVSLLPNLVEKD